jgi:hypothetical protein
MHKQVVRIPGMFEHKFVKYIKRVGIVAHLVEHVRAWEVQCIEFKPLYYQKFLYDFVYIKVINTFL